MFLLPHANVLDPRRKPWPKGGDMGEQVRWEHDHLRKATVVLFWFPNTSICPIALFELGSMWERGARVVVGCEPGYARHADIYAQARAFGKGGYIYKDLNQACHAVLRVLSITGEPKP